MLEDQMWRLEKFKTYGLNVNRTFLRDAQDVIVDDIVDFAVDLLSVHNCDESAVFLRYLNGDMMAIVKDGEEYYTVDCATKNDVNFYAEVDAKYRLCCYGILVEATPDVWKAVDK